MRREKLITISARKQTGVYNSKQSQLSFEKASLLSSRTEHLFFTFPTKEE